MYMLYASLRPMSLPACLYVQAYLYAYVRENACASPYVLLPLLPIRMLACMCVHIYIYMYRERERGKACYVS